MLDVNKIKKLSHLSYEIKTFLKFYPWKNCAPESYAKPVKPLNKSNIAIVSSAGLSIRNKQEKFDSKIKFGDSSFREIPSSIKMDNLIESHNSRTFDHSGIINNPETVMPIPH